MNLVDSCLITPRRKKPVLSAYVRVGIHIPDDGPSEGIESWIG
jgi:hypothetical protein